MASIPVFTSRLGFTSSTYNAFTSLKRVAKMSRFLAISKYRSVGEVKESVIKTTTHISPANILFLISVNYSTINAVTTEKISNFNDGKKRVLRVLLSEKRSEFIRYLNDPDHNLVGVAILVQ